MTLELKGLTKVYKDKTALDDVSFHLHPAYMGFWDLMEPVNQL